jgi:hypothetical protein
MATESKQQTPAEIFAGLVLAGQCEEPGGYDGFDIEEMLIKAGLFVQVTVTERCDDDCACGEYGFPTKCNRLSRAGKRALKAAKSIRKATEPEKTR